MPGSILPIIIHIFLHGAKQCRIFIAADSGSRSVPLPVVLHSKSKFVTFTRGVNYCGCLVCY